MVNKGGRRRDLSYAQSVSTSYFVILIFYVIIYGNCMWIKALHRRAKQLDYWDLKMSGVAMISLGFVFARLVPELIDVSQWWWLTLFVLFILRPLYHFWVRPSGE